MSMLFFSNIIGTLNRPECLQSCLTSLVNQKYKNFEVIIIDQSDNNLSKSVVDTFYNKLQIKYIKVDFKGLSKARNKGLQVAKGDYFCLLDDDAFYDEKYLENAKNTIEVQENNIILSGFIFDTIKNKPFVKYPRKLNRDLTINEVIRYCPSAALIIPSDIHRRIGGFDENFGVGSKFGCGEETDYLLRALKIDYKVRYYSHLKLSHPVPNNNGEVKTDINKQKYYSRGIGALYKKHLIIGREINLIGPFTMQVLKNAVKILLPIKYNSKLSFAMLCGFFCGIKEYKNGI